MKRTYLMGALALASMATFAKNSGDGAPAPEAPTPAAEEAPKVTKSIVPAKYGNKYKSGGSDDLAKFINEQSSGREGFEFPAFFALCRKNGIDEAKVAHYEGLVAAKAHGAEGRARMTLRNMLATPARKNGKLIALDGTEVTLDVAKPAVSGAAAKAQEAQGEAAA